MVQVVSPLHIEFCNIRGSRRRLARKGDFLAREGDPSNYVFRVRSGGLMLLSEHEDGSYIATDWAGPNGLCGLEDAICGMPYRCSCRATAVTVVECLPAEELRRIMKTDPAIALAVANYLSARVRFVSHHAEVLARDGLPERVRETLRVLAEREIDDGRPPALRFTQGDLAALVGASRQRVNPILAGLRRAGLIDFQGGIIRILSATAL